MRSIIKNIIRFVILGTTTLFMAACYGVMMTFDDFPENKEITAVDRDNNPIPGLEVTYREFGNDISTTFTNNEGKALVQDPCGDEGKESFYTNEKNYGVVISDIDGEENGGLFKDAEIVFTEKMVYTVTMESDITK